MWGKRERCAERFRWNTLEMATLNSIQLMESLMKKMSYLAAAALLAGSTTFAASGPVAAAPLMRDNGISNAAVTSNVTDVRWRGRGFRGGHRGYGYRGYGYRGYGYRRGPGGAAVLGGLAAGAIIGGAIANSQAQGAVDADAYCSRRYRSYDPASGTYLNNDGNRYPCP